MSASASGLDHSLIYQARKFITGANVHYVKTWIFCYETSEPESEGRRRYEKLLREFVATRNLILAARIKVKHKRDQLMALQEEMDRRFY